MSTEYSDYIHFVIIYTIEAHPFNSPSPYSDEEWTTPASTDAEGCTLNQPANYEERTRQATQMAEELEITIPVLTDEMDNPVWCTYGPAPNSAYFIGTDGRIIVKQGWYQPELMKMAVAAYLTSE